MKIMMIMEGFFPGKEYGGPPVSVDNFCSLMKSDDCYIVTKNHDKGSPKEYEGIKTATWIRRPNASVMYLSDNEYKKKNFEKIIIEIKPDLLYLQGLFQGCVLPCLEIAKKHKINIMLAPRGELCSGAFKKKYKKIPYILFLRLLGLLKEVSYQSTSSEETNAIIRYLKSQETRVHFLSNTPSIPKEEYVHKEKNAGYARFVFLSRIHPKKNLISAISYFKDIEGNATFDIYGPIEDQEYWMECQKEISKLPNNIVVNYCGLVSHDEVHEVFSRYNAFLFPTHSENYGHVIIEALIVGTPVIISDQTPWNDVLTNGCGWAISLSDANRFSECIQTVINMDNDTFQKQSINASQYAYRKSDLTELYNHYVKAFRCAASIER